jgi:hypothetical protein
MISILIPLNIHVMCSPLIGRRITSFINKYRDFLVLQCSCWWFWFLVFYSVSDGDYVLICSTVSVGDYRMVWCFIACLMVIMFWCFVLCRLVIMFWCFIVCPSVIMSWCFIVCLSAGHMRGGSVRTSVRGTGTQRRGLWIS